MLFLRFPDQNTSPIKAVTSPTVKEEEIYFTHLVQIKLEQSNTVVCKTREQPIVLRKVTKPAEKSYFASSPLRKRRANQLNKMRTDMSGSSAADSVKQQGTELKLTRKQERTEILKAAGCGRYTFHQNWP